MVRVSPTTKMDAMVAVVNAAEAKRRRWDDALEAYVQERVAAATARLEKENQELSSAAKAWQDRCLGLVAFQEEKGKQARQTYKDWLLEDIGTFATDTLAAMAATKKKVRVVAAAPEEIAVSYKVYDDAFMKIADSLITARGGVHKPTDYMGFRWSISRDAWVTTSEGFLNAIFKAVGKDVHDDDDIENVNKYMSIRFNHTTAIVMVEKTVKFDAAAVKLHLNKG